MAKTLRLVLGDQLSRDVSALKGATQRDVVLMAEVRTEATYVPHHPQKIAFLFSAMRHFAEELRGKGLAVDYVTYDAPNNQGSLAKEVARAVKEHSCEKVVCTFPGEWRVWEDMKAWEEVLDVPVEICEDDRFLFPLTFFKSWAEGRKQLRMEYFYREGRRQTGLLMDGENPEGGQWNYDHENRGKYDGKVPIPERPKSEVDDITRDVITLVQKHFVGHAGALSEEGFRWAVTAQDAEAQFQWFVHYALPHFGQYQDAMVEDAMKPDSAFLFHGLIGAYLNAGLLNPLTVCQEVEAAYKAGRVPIEAAEGFIRQVLGWREYVRGLYWLKMPNYAEENFLGAEMPLPNWFWSGETTMNCLKQSIGQTLEYAYAHHIQRLMVIGNFSLLAGLNSTEVQAWFLAVYADAYEWVELPNVNGMALFADGGTMASKPYAASASYINKMSNYCQNCTYCPKTKTGESRSGKPACPFNSLYWHFMDRHTDKLAKNPRMAMMYRNWEKQDPQQKQDVLAQAERYLTSLNDL